MVLFMNRLSLDLAQWLNAFTTLRGIAQALLTISDIYRYASVLLFSLSASTVSSSRQDTGQKLSPTFSIHYLRVRSPERSGKSPSSNRHGTIYSHSFFAFVAIIATSVLT